MLINLKNIQKTYNTKTGVSFRAISNVSLSFDERGMVFLIGKSGSGKTTLLNLIGGLDTIDSGSVYIGGKNLSRLSSSEVDSFRNTMVGFVFQEFNLIDYMTVYENVKLALDMQSDKDGDKVEAALEKVNLTDKRDEKVKNLSGGQRQRVGIARAIVKNPEIILADEPTGALDHSTGEEIMGIFKQLSKDKLVIMVSHDAEKAVMYADRIVEMKDGTVYRDVRRKKPGEKIDLSQINITSNTLIRLEKGVTLKDGDAAQINEILNEKGRKAYINVDTNANKMKALFPNLREAVDSGLPQDEDNGKDGQSDTLQEKESFIPYKPADTEVKKISFIKSKLPTKKALRIGVKNLNLKKGKMIATIVIAVLAFILFGASISFYNFDLNQAYINTIKKGDYHSIIAKNAAGGNYHIKETDIIKLEAAQPKIGVFRQYRVAFQSSQYNNFSAYFNSFVETDNAQDMELEMVAGSSVPLNHNSIIISQATARMFLRSGSVSGANDYPDLIGKSLALSGMDNVYREYTIGGIFKTDLEKYKADKNNEKYYNDVANYIEGVMVVKTGFKEAYATDCLTYFGGGGYLNSYMVNFRFTDSYNYGQNINIIPNDADLCRNYNIGVDYNITLYSPNNPLNYDMFDLKENQIIASLNTLQNLGIFVPQADGDPYENPYDNDDGQYNKYSQKDVSPLWFQNSPGQTTVEYFNSDENRSITISRGDTPYYFSSDVEIVGVAKGDFEGVIMNSDSMKSMLVSQMYTSKVMLVLSGSNKTDASLVRYLSANGFAVESDFANGYNTLLGVVAVLYKVIIGFAIALSLLVVVLLFTFISSSIKLTRKQIGILRALGARKIDTFKIYALEGIVIGLISFVVTLAILLIVAPIINLIISSSMGYYFSVLTIGFKDIGSVFILMAAVTLVSILIPLRKFNKITPIKAIVEKE